VFPEIKIFEVLQQAFLVDVSFDISVFSMISEK